MHQLFSQDGSVQPESPLKFWFNSNRPLITLLASRGRISQSHSLFRVPFLEPGPHVPRNFLDGWVINQMPLCCWLRLLEDLGPRAGADGLDFGLGDGSLQGFSSVSPLAVCREIELLSLMVHYHLWVRPRPSFWINEFPLIPLLLFRCCVQLLETPWTAAHQASLSFTHVHWVSDAIQPSHPLSPSSSALNLSQPQGLSQWVGSSHQVAKVWGFSFSISPSVNIQSWFPLGLLDLLAV